MRIHYTFLAIMNEQWILTPIMRLNLGLSPFECNNFKYMHRMRYFQVLAHQNNLEFCLVYNDFWKHQNGHWIIPPLNAIPWIYPSLFIIISHSGYIRMDIGLSPFECNTLNLTLFIMISGNTRMDIGLSPFECNTLNLTLFIMISGNVRMDIGLSPFVCLARVDNITCGTVFWCWNVKSRKH